MKIYRSRRVLSTGLKPSALADNPLDLHNSSYHLQQKEKTNSSYKHNKKVSHGIFNLTFRMLQHTSSEVTVTKSDEI